MFSQQLASFAKKAEENTERARRIILLRLFRSVVFDTPVKEGTLRGAWQPSVNSTSITPSNRTGRSSGNATNKAIEEMVEASRFGDTVYLTNPLPYGPRIEYEGWSRVKAPQGMVRKNVARLTRIASAVAKGVNSGSI